MDSIDSILLSIFKTIGIILLSISLVFLFLKGLVSWVRWKREKERKKDRRLRYIIRCPACTGLGTIWRPQAFGEGGRWFLCGFCEGKRVVTKAEADVYKRP